MTLKEAKAELREEIRALKSVLKDLKKTEHSGITDGGYVTQSSKYEMMKEIEFQLHGVEKAYSIIKNITKLR